MNVYDLININSNDIESSIKDTISEVREELGDLDKELTCKIYSSYVNEGLRKRHIVSRLIDSSDLDCFYAHQFNLVPKDDKEYYLVDLTYEQFKNKKFPNLVSDGYMLVDNDSFNEYLEVVGYKSFGITLDEAFDRESMNIK